MDHPNIHCAYTYTYMYCCFKITFFNQLTLIDEDVLLLCFINNNDNNNNNIFNSIIQ